MRALATVLLLLLVGCNRADDPKLQDAKYRATMESRGVGRFQLISASVDYPPLLLDTVTGCVEVINRAGTYSKLPVFSGGSVDKACLGNMPRDTERQVAETLRK